MGARDVARNGPARPMQRSVVTTQIEHCQTGIAGLDQITNGGLPMGRTTLLTGGPGCGKTLFGTSFLIHGAARGEPGVFVAFEERPDELAANAASLGQDLQQLIDAGMLEV